MRTRPNASKLISKARRDHEADLLRRFRASGNPFSLIEALLTGANGEIGNEAKVWLRVSLAKALGIAVGRNRGKPIDIARAFGINAKHIREAHSEFRNATIRRMVVGRDKKRETIEDVVSAIADGVPGAHGPVIHGLSKLTIARIAKSKPLRK